MNQFVKGCVVLGLVLGLAGCFSNSSTEDSDLDALITEIIKHNQEVQEQEQERLNKGIQALEVSGDAVTANLDQASIPVVVKRILEDADAAYVIEDVSLHGMVTARFTDLALVDALNRIVHGIGLAAVEDNGLLVIKSSFDEDAEGEAVHREVAIRNLSQASAMELLEGIYPEGDMGRLVKFGAVAASNSIYLYGAPANVAQAAQLLAKADREAKHVSIEVLVVEFNRGELEEYDSMIQELVEGDFTWNVNDAFNGMVGVNWSDQANGGGSDGGSSEDFSEFKVTSMKGVVEMLVSDQKARLISRPFISTLSGTEAQIEIVSDRYVNVGSNDEPETSEVTSGVILQITPTVLPDGKIRMNVSVEDSQFSSVNVQGVLSEVNKNAARTIMHVNDGHTIVVGGLVLNRRSTSNEGFPFLRNIPLINLLTAGMKHEQVEKEVTIYITPRIWEPNMLTPLIGPGALGGDDNEGIFRK